MSAAFRQRQRSAQDATLIDLTPDGACIETDRMQPDDQGWLKLPTLSDWLAHIVWQKGARHGLCFATPYHPAVVETIIKRAQAISSMQYESTEIQPPPNFALAGASRREQIMAGVATPPHSPLLTRKSPVLGQTPDGMNALVPRNASRRSNHRHEDRHSGVVHHANMMRGDEYIPVTILNISESGLMIESADQPAIGDVVGIKFDAFDRIDGRVTWRRGARFGVSLGSGAIDLFEVGQ